MEMGSLVQRKLLMSVQLSNGPFHLKSTHPLWKKASKQKFQFNQMQKPAGKLCQFIMEFQLKYCDKSLISVPFHLDFMKSVFSLSNSS